jgi:hypothetical protein
MAIKLGTTTASLYLGSTPVAAYLGAEQVYSAVSVPGAPTITYAITQEDLSSTFVGHTTPPDGGSSITGYKYYFNGVEVFASNSDGSQAEFSGDFIGQEVEVSAVNAVGEGPKSAPVTVVLDAP